METTQLEAIHRELKSINERLHFIEDLVEEVIVKGLPKAKLSNEERTEIGRSIAEMRRGRRVTLEELRSA